MAHWTLTLGLFLLTAIFSQVTFGQEQQAGGPTIIRTAPLVIPCQDCLQRGGSGGGLESGFGTQEGSDCCCCGGFEDASVSLPSSSVNGLASILAGIFGNLGGQSITFQTPESCDCFCEEPVVMQAPVIETSNLNIQDSSTYSPRPPARESTALQVSADNINSHHPGTAPPCQVPYGRSPLNPYQPRDPSTFYQPHPYQPHGGYYRDPAKFSPEMNHNLYLPGPLAPPPVNHQYAVEPEKHCISESIPPSYGDFSRDPHLHSFQFSEDSSKFQVQPLGQVSQMMAPYNKDASNPQSQVDLGSHNLLGSRPSNTGNPGGPPAYSKQSSDAIEYSQNTQGEQINSYSQGASSNVLRGYNRDPTSYDPSVYYRQNDQTIESPPEKPYPAKSKQTSNQGYLETDETGFQKMKQGFGDESPWLYVENIDGSLSPGTYIQGRGENKYLSNDNRNLIAKQEQGDFVVPQPGCSNPEFEMISKLTSKLVPSKGDGRYDLPKGPPNPVLNEETYRLM